ncbi:Ribokinase-like protein, partial [Cutaneotrichosporon oleaginosum]
IGGGAMYALIGARVWLAPQSLRTVIDRSPEFPGDDEFDDLPLKLEKQLHSYGPEMWVFNRVPGARVPTARIRYDDAVRSYAHIVKPAVRSGRELASGPLAGAEWLHVPPPYSSTALLGLISELSLTSWHPRIVFEPAPTSCHPGELTAFEKAAALVDVLSPNHEELLSLYARPIPDDRQEIIEAVEKVMRHLLALGVGSRGKGILAIRCSSLGACIGTAEGGICWIPSFFQGEQHRVQDVTGAGNAFIGGYIAGLYLTGDPYEAALHGTVSASFVIEQLGPPILHFTPEGERWNGDSAESRLATL